MNKANRINVLAMVLCFTLASMTLGQAAYMSLKAHLAQWLIARSWHTSDAPTKPWPWADTHVSAKLTYHGANNTVEHYVMVDASGESLAFGPGFVHDESELTQASGGAIAGHRDTHFEFLQYVQVGDQLSLERNKNRTTRFRVIGTRVINTQSDQVSLPLNNELMLITCFPFNDWVPGGPLRFILIAEMLDSKSQEQAKPQHTT